MHTRAMLASVLILAIASMGLFGCGARQPATTGTPTPTPTATPLPTATGKDFMAACAGAGDSWQGPTLYRLGDLLVSAGTYYGIASRKLPDDTALKPLLIPDPSDSAAVDTRFPAQPAVNPVEMGFAFTVCNASRTHAHDIDSVITRIDQFTPYTGHVQTWTECDGAYTRSDPHGVVGGGCGYGVHADETLKVTFPAQVAAGTEMTATWIQSAEPTDSTRTAPFGPLPVSLPAGQFLFVLVTGVPVATGTYSMSVALTIDHARLPGVPIGSPALFAPTAQRWTGEACQTPSMQALIPGATTPPSFYICPAK